MTPGPKALVGLSPRKQPLSRAFLPSSSSRTGSGSGRAFRGAGAACWRPLDVVPPAQLPHGARIPAPAGRVARPASKPNPWAPQVQLGFRATLSRAGTNRPSAGGARGEVAKNRPGGGGVGGTKLGRGGA